MSIVFEEIVGQVDAPSAPSAEGDEGARPTPAKEPERDRVRAAVCRERRRAARLEAD